MYGYKLFMTTDSNTTDLVRDNSADSVAATIPTLTNTGNPCTTSYNNSTFTTNSWGYRINNNVGGETNCIDTTNTNYYSYTPGTLISSATTATNEQTATLTFASKIDYLKPAGQYALTLKMSALPIVTTYYMQDIAASPTLASSVCTEEPTVVLDKRDEQAYTIRRINGTCWMVENLQFTGTTMDSTTSNIAPEYTPSNPYTTTYYDLETDGGSEGNCGRNLLGYTNPCIHKDNITVQNTPISSSNPSATISTVWYNYAAASAGTIAGNPNTDPQIYDICPKGWRLPNDLEIDSIVNNNTSQFNIVAGGIYADGAPLLVDDSGRWWGSNTSTLNGAKESQARSILIYDLNRNPIVQKFGQNRHFGLYTRCVMRDTSTTLSDISTMQEMTPDIAYSTPVNVTKQLTDTRESGANSYWVAKLTDGKIWMTQNLRLGNNSSSVLLTPADSNVTTNTTFNNKIAAPGTIASSYYKTVTDSRTGATDARVYDGWLYYCTPVSGYTTNYYRSCYYNWYTATASTGKEATPAQEVDASASICPKGWFLPHSGEIAADNDFTNLKDQYPNVSDILVNDPTNCGSSNTAPCDNASGTYKPGLLLSGNYLAAGAKEVNQRGMYWGRTAYSNGYAYSMLVNSSSITPMNYYHKYSAIPVRCLAY